MERDNGGPAFPRTPKRIEWNGEIQFTDAQDGMSLRDYFAAQVISQCQITVEKHAPEPDPMLVEAYAFRYARTAYAIADAMLVERQKFKRPRGGGQ